METFIPNATQCQLCGAAADRYGSLDQCRTVPTHIGDPETGMFEDVALMVEHPCERDEDRQAVWAARA